MPFHTPAQPLPWHRTPIDKETLSALNARSNFRGLIQMGLHLGGYVALGAAVFWLLMRGYWAGGFAMLFVYGTVASFLTTGAAGHELSHYTVFRSRWLNVVFGRLVYFLSWQSLTCFRSSHAAHHRWTVHHGLDGEQVLPRPMPKWWQWPFIFTIDIPTFLRRLLSNIRFSIGRANNEWEAFLFTEQPEERKKLIREARITLIGHIVLATVFLATGLWPLVLLVNLGNFTATWLVFAVGHMQHAGMRPDVPDFRLSTRSMRLGLVTGFLYWQMHNHIEHHMYASVPFYNLNKLRKLCEHDLPPAKGLIASWLEAVPVLRRQKAEPNLCMDVQLPPTAAPAKV